MSYKVTLTLKFPKKGIISNAHLRRAMEDDEHRMKCLETVMNTLNDRRREFLPGAMAAVREGRIATGQWRGSLVFFPFTDKIFSFLPSFHHCEFNAGWGNSINLKT